ncbi:hypothetical protein K2173_006525 [Erythroxylum novogranatense]|uniref:Protein TIFY n=1 Tax=Erythroxylum novogranatense TaxID=1862640 RepID=A0AAV8T5R6_9ROSI|nr:hypothetical protein K2173_006525 [Erythroxylum novogranatense]
MRNVSCNLELRLVSPVGCDDDHRKQEHSDESSPQEQQQQQLTIFYNGSVCVSDVTELQARSILMLASRDMEDKVRISSVPTTPSPTISSPLHTPGLSMKRSLQRFLQKRNDRIQSTSPYNSLRYNQRGRFRGLTC